jgi:hypothetical protein
MSLFKTPPHLVLTSFSLLLNMSADGPPGDNEQPASGGTIDAVLHPDEAVVHLECICGDGRLAELRITHAERTGGQPVVEQGRLHGQAHQSSNIVIGARPKKHQSLFHLHASSASLDEITLDVFYQDPSLAVVKRSYNKTRNAWSEREPLVQEHQLLGLRTDSLSYDALTRERRG